MDTQGGFTVNPPTGIARCILSPPTTSPFAAKRRQMPPIAANRTPSRCQSPPIASHRIPAPPNRIANRIPSRCQTPPKAQKKRSWHLLFPAARTARYRGLGLWLQIGRPALKIGRGENRLPSALLQSRRHQRRMFLL